MSLLIRNSSETFNYPSSYHINDLPNELLLNIFNYLDLETTQSISQTCKRWRPISFESVKMRNFHLLNDFMNFLEIDKNELEIKFKSFHDFIVVKSSFIKIKHDLFIFLIDKDIETLESLKEKSKNLQKPKFFEEMISSALAFKQLMNKPQKPESYIALILQAGIFPKRILQVLDTLKKESKERENILRSLVMLFAREGKFDDAAKLSNDLLQIIKLKDDLDLRRSELKYLFNTLISTKKTNTIDIKKLILEISNFLNDISPVKHERQAILQDLFLGLYDHGFFDEAKEVSKKIGETINGKKLIAMYKKRLKNYDYFNAIIILENLAKYKLDLIDEKILNLLLEKKLNQFNCLKILYLNNFIITYNQTLGVKNLMHFFEKINNFSINESEKYLLINEGLKSIHLIKEGKERIIYQTYNTLKNNFDIDQLINDNIIEANIFQNISSSAIEETFVPEGENEQKCAIM